MTQEPTKVDLESPDIAAEKLTVLKDLFPDLLVDGVLNADRLGELLDVPVAQAPGGRERFGLQWAGKQEAVHSLLTPSRAALLPDIEESVGFDTAQHAFIEGDNLEVLKLLQKAYNDRVKLIYIDPPYNTGSNDFIYPDNFSDPLQAYLEYTGQIDSAGNRLSASTDTTGRRHSRWLSMMYPRLVLARNLLTQDGVIFVSIDDNEVANLRILMDEVFGAENFIATVIWQKVFSPKNTARHFSVDHDYILIYARNSDVWSPFLLPRTEGQDASYKNPDNDPRGSWASSDLSARNYYSKGTYSVLSPTGHATPGPPPGRYWTISEDEFLRLDADNRVWWGGDGRGMPRRKRFLSEVMAGRVPQTLWPYGEVGHTQDAKKELLRRVEFASSASVFDTPKPTQLIRRMLALATEVNSGDVIMDFFAGSGSTGDAVLQQNAQDGGNRRFVLVQLPEPTGHSDFEFVSDITRARLKAAIADVGGRQSIRGLRLGESSFHQQAATADGALFALNEATLVAGASDWNAIAAEILLKEGVPLHAPWSRQAVGGAEIVVADGVAVVLSRSLDQGLVDAAFAMKPRVVVFMEDGFADADAVKANAFTNARNANIAMKTV